MNRPTLAALFAFFAWSSAASLPAAESSDGDRERQAALAAAEARVAAAPDDVRALLGRGDARFFLGRFDEAVADYDRIIALRPDLGPTHWQRGLALHFAGRHADAAKQFERFYELDKSDRENGVWRFYAQVKRDGVEKARAALLKYELPDREPLPAVYRLCAGEVGPEAVAASAEAAGLSDDERAKRRFYADLYLGLDAAIVRNDPAAARPLFERAVKNPWPADAGYGPAFMRQVARLSLERL